MGQTSSLSRIIMNRPSYEFTENSKLKLLNVDENYKLNKFRNQYIKAFLLNTKNLNKIACIYLNLTTSPKFTLICNHGGTVDLGNVVNYYFTLGKLLNCNVVGYDYSGYGISTGVHSENNLLDDCETVLNYVLQELNIKLSKIVLQGQSLGTVAAIHLSSLNRVAGVILISPFLNLNHLKGNFFIKHNSFKVEKILSPLLIIHGTDDDVTPLSQAREIYEISNNPVEPLFIKNIGHWEIELDENLLDRIKRFVLFEI